MPECSICIKWFSMYFTFSTFSQSGCPGDGFRLLFGDSWWPWGHIFLILEDINNWDPNQDHGHDCDRAPLEHPRSGDPSQLRVTYSSRWQ